LIIGIVRSWFHSWFVRRSEGACKPFLQRDWCNAEHAAHSGDIKRLVFHQAANFVAAQLRQYTGQLGSTCQQHQHPAGYRQDSRRRKAGGACHRTHKISVWDRSRTGNHH
jgi:hypothetical protein